MQKQTLKRIGIVIGGIFILGFLFITVNDRLKSARDEKTMVEYENLITKENIVITEVIKYLDAHLKTLSKDNASHLVLGLEALQQERLAQWQKRYENSALQEKIASLYQKTWTLGNLLAQAQNSGEKDLADILQETAESGFKVETAEGTFFPVIDYTFYRRYQSALTEDLLAYFELMAIESEQTPVKDAALMIGWDEILSRGESQEDFIERYRTSTQVEPVRRLLKRYVTFALFGCNNTPLFSYDTKQMNFEARQAFEKHLRTERDGDFSALLAEFLKVLEENNFQLTKAVDDFRKDAVAAW